MTNHHHVLYDVATTTDLRLRLQALEDEHGVAFAAPRAVVPSGGARSADDPSQRQATRTPLLRPLPDGRPGRVRRAPADSGAEARGGGVPRHTESTPLVPVWHWAGNAADLRTDARRVLNHLVYPLAAEGRPFCLAFPFDRAQLAPRSLDVQRRSQLDVEDIGALLDAGAPSPLAPAHVAAPALQGLDPDQHAAACHGGGPARVLAAAGSGKTKTMVARIAGLVARGAAPQNILVLAFNAEAALQLEERLAAVGVPTTRRVEQDAGGVHCATFNAFGYRFQQQVLGDAPSVTAAGAAQEKLLRLVLAQDRGGGDSEHRALDPYDAALSDDAVALAQALDRWRAELIAPGDAHRTAIARHDRLQKSRGLQTFDDQVIATVCALLAEPAYRRLLHDIYRFVLVDEFQDVNPAQQLLLDILSRPWRNLFVVGDDDQLIYGWRAAHAGSIIDFGADLPPAPHTVYYTLPTNYRCSSEIVARAEQLVVNNQRRAHKSMRARPTAPPGSVLFAAATGPRQLGLEIAAFLAAEQSRLACAWADLAVLARYRTQLEALRGTLHSLSIPLGAANPQTELDPKWAMHLDRQLRAALEDDRLCHLSAAAVIDQLAATIPAGAETAQNVLDTARLLACDHAAPAGLSAAWRRLTGLRANAWSGTTASPSRHLHDNVTLATIHSTKGREYASVAIVDFAPALTPLSADEREEERRVLYVALTRARHMALLTVPPGEQGPHPFVRELGRPPQRAECRALRRDLANARERLSSRSRELPPALRELLDEPSGFGPGLTPRSTSPDDPALSQTAALFLQARSRLLERRLFAPRPAARLVAALR